MSAPTSLATAGPLPGIHRSTFPTSDPAETLVLVASTSSGGSLYPSTISLTGTQAENFFKGTSVTIEASSFASALASNLQHGPTGTGIQSTASALSLASSQVKGPVATSAITKTAAVASSNAAGTSSIPTNASASGTATTSTAPVSTTSATGAATYMGPDATMAALPLLGLLLLGFFGLLGFKR